MGIPAIQTVENRKTQLFLGSDDMEEARDQLEQEVADAARDMKRARNTANSTVASTQPPTKAARDNALSH